MNRALDHPVPYTLRRPFFTFFHRYSIAFPPLTAVIGVFAGEIAFLTVLITGSICWLTFGLCLLTARHNVTIYDDGLFFEIFGKKYSVRYADLRWVDVVVPVGYTGYGWYQLWIAWEGVEDRPLFVNFELFARRDRALLMRTIATLAPHALLNDVAKELASAA